MQKVEFTAEISRKVTGGGLLFILTLYRPTSCAHVLLSGVIRDDNNV